MNEAMKFESRARLEVRDLDIVAGDVTLVHGLSFDLAPGELLALAGESGSGKSVSSLAVLGLLPPSLRVSGSIRFGDVELTSLDARSWRTFRAKRARIILQDPWSALNPVLSVGYQLIESVRTARAVSHREGREIALDLLQRVGVSDPLVRMAAYPRSMSGGILQRIVIAMALAAEPALIICDEPTTALDATTEAQIMQLIRTLCTDLNVAVLMTSHDLGVIGQYSDRMVVMYAGRIVDEARTDVALADPQHPYTRALVNSTPGHSTVPPRTNLPTLDGTPPAAGEVTTLGCSLAPRCPLRQPVCDDNRPLLLVNPRTGGRTACWVVNPETEA